MDFCLKFILISSYAINIATYIVFLHKYIHVNLNFSTTVYSKPTIKVLQNSKIIAAIGPKWYELGIELLDDDRVIYLETIKANHNEATRCCITMFIHWLQSEPSATWHQLAEALKAPGVEMSNVAAMVEELFTGLYINHAVTH